MRGMTCLLALLMTGALTAGPAAAQTADEEASATVESDARLIRDPLEPVNRAVFRFNLGLDRIVFRPAARVYRTAVPTYGRRRLRDFFTNLGTPISFANQVLQGDFEEAGVSAARFAINTTAGLAGFYDVAETRADLPHESEDFGQTLARYGAGSGAYLVLPIVGPTSTRDVVGSVADYALDPLTWTQFTGDDAFRISTGLTEGLDRRAQADDVVDSIRNQADPYAYARALWVQSRESAINEDEDPYADLPAFE